MHAVTDRPTYRVLSVNDRIDGVGIIQSLTLVEAFREANAYLDVAGQGRRAVVWIPPSVDPGLDDAGREDAVREYLRGYAKGEDQKVTEYRAKEIGQWPQVFVPHVDGIVEGKYEALPDHLHALVQNRDCARRCVRTKRGVGSRVYAARLSVGDIHTNGDVAPLGYPKLGEPFILPPDSALFLNHYGLIEDRLVHAASDLCLSLPAGGVGPDQIIRIVERWDYNF